MIAAPYLLKFADIAPALWAYLAIGVLLATMHQFLAHTLRDLTHRFRLSSCPEQNFRTPTFCAGVVLLSAKRAQDNGVDAYHRS